MCPFMTILGLNSSGTSVLISSAFSSFAEGVSFLGRLTGITRSFSGKSFPNSFTSKAYCSSLIRVLGLSSTSNPFLRRKSTTVLIPTFNFRCTCINFIGISNFVVTHLVIHLLVIRSFRISLLLIRYALSILLRGSFRCWLLILKLRRENTQHIVHRLLLQIGTFD